MPETNIDGFTAGAMLHALQGDASRAEIHDMLKSFKREGNGPTKEQVKWVLENMGRAVSINNTDYTGKITALNTSTGGFYEGGRYPVYVTIDDDVEVIRARGATFEYEIDQLTLKDR